MMMASLRTAMIVAVTVLLAACAASKSGSSVASPEPKTQAVEPPAADAQATAPPKPKAKPKPAQLAAIQPPPTKSDQGKEEQADLPDVGAVGLDEARLKLLLGDPAAETDNDPQKVLRFRAGKCLLEFALYPDVEARVYRTLSYEVANDDGTAKGRRSCIADLRARLQAAK